MSLPDQSTAIMNLTGPDPATFLSLPSEIRNFIYRLTLTCPEEIHLNSNHNFQRQRTSDTQTRTKLATGLLYANRQLYYEARFILYSENTFCVTINELSHMGHHTIGPQVDVEHIIPAMWPLKTRLCIYSIRRLVVNVELRREYYCAGDMMIEAITSEDARDAKNEFTSVVHNALDELCTVLAESDLLKEIDIRFVDRGWPVLTQGDEHRILEPLTCLRKLIRVNCTGVPAKFADYLVRTMQQQSIKGGLSDIGDGALYATLKSRV